MPNYYKDKLNKFFSNLSKKLKNKTILNEKDMNSLFLGALDLLNIPYPASEIKKFFLHPNIVADLLIELINSNFLTPDDRFELNPTFDEIHKKLRKPKSSYSYKLRILAPGGLYPNLEIKRGYSRYFIQNQQPTLLTKNKNYKDIFSNLSIINWLTKNELKFATALMCAPKQGIFHLEFAGYNTINIDCDCVDAIPDGLKNLFLREYFEIKKRFTPVGVRAWHRQPMPDLMAYEFSSYNDSIEFFNKIYDNFKISDHLLLRTCNYFVKAIMHWNNQIYFEEAITNTFFCLEGCLHLIQKKYGYYELKLNMNLLKGVFKNDIAYGENLFEFIKEGYEKRITLVHAEPEWGADWSPFLTSEDFYEYFDLCRELLNFILIDRRLDDL